MATATYTGTLTDVGVNSLAGYTPELTVRPERECWGPDGPLTDTRVKITLTGDAFSVDLTPSTQLTNDKGVTGVGYILEVTLLGALNWGAEWRFNALPGGGSIADMIGVPADPGPPYWTLVTQAQLDARVAGLTDELRLVHETGTATDLNVVPPVSAVMTADINTSNIPTDGAWTVFHQRTGASANSGTQLAIGSNTASGGRVFVRRLAGGTWGDWQQILRRSDLVADGLIAQKGVHAEGGDWVYDGPDDPAATHYILHDPYTGRLFVAPRVFPRPSALAPELDW